MPPRVTSYTVEIGTARDLEIAIGEDREYHLAYTLSGSPIDFTGAKSITMAVKNRATGAEVFSRGYTGFVGAASLGVPKFPVYQTDTESYQEDTYDLDVSWVDANDFKTQLQLASRFRFLKRVGAPGDTVTMPPATPVVYGINWRDEMWTAKSGGYNYGDGVEAFDGSLGATAISSFRTNAQGVTLYPVDASLMLATGWRYVGQHGGAGATGVTGPMGATGPAGGGGSGSGLSDPSGFTGGTVPVVRSQGWNFGRLTLDDIDPAFSISSFAGGAGWTSIMEVGATLTNPAFTAAYTSLPASATINDGSGALALNTPFNAFAYTGGNARAYSKTVTGQSVTQALQAIGATTKNANLSTTWESRVFFDTVVSGTINAAFIQALTGQALATSFARTIAFANPGGTKQMFYAFETAFGTPSHFKDTAINADQAWTKVGSAIAVTNSLGITKNYDVWTNTNLLNAAFTIAVS